MVCFVFFVSKVVLRKISQILDFWLPSRYPLYPFSTRPLVETVGSKR